MYFIFQNIVRHWNNFCNTLKLFVPLQCLSYILFLFFYYDKYRAPNEIRLNIPHVKNVSIIQKTKLFLIPTGPVARPEEWNPFIYIEIFPSILRLHIPPPPSRLKIKSYRIAVMKECGKDFGCEVRKTSVILNDRTEEVTYDYNFVGENGLFYFLMTPMHRACEAEGRCRNVESPKIKISKYSI